MLGHETTGHVKPSSMRKVEDLLRAGMPLFSIHAACKRCGRPTAKGAHVCQEALTFKSLQAPSNMQKGLKEAFTRLPMLNTM